MRHPTWIAAALLLTACGEGDHSDCSVQATSASFCVPAAAPAGTPFVLEGGSRCSDGCVVDVSCAVERDGSTFELHVSELSCGTSCQMACKSKPVGCELPALDEGTYSVKVAGSPIAETLVVAAQADPTCVE